MPRRPSPGCHPERSAVLSGAEPKDPTAPSSAAHQSQSIDACSAALSSLASLDLAMCATPGLPEDPERRDHVLATWMMPFLVAIAPSLIVGAIIPDRLLHLASLVGVDLQSQLSTLNSQMGA